MFTCSNRVFVCEETHPTGGSVWVFFFFKLYGCWCVCSLLVQPPLSHLLLLISMETGPGAFSHIHTLAINQQVRPGSIPTHTHRTDENKEHTHTDTAPNHRNIPEHTLVDLDHTSLSGSDLAFPNLFVYQIWQPSDVSIAFSTLSDGCSLVAPSTNTRTLVPISCSLFYIFMGWIGEYYCVNLLSNLSGRHEWPHWSEECIPMYWLLCVNVRGV